MQNQLDLEIHNQLVLYLAREMSLKGFRDWFDSATWDVEQSGNAAARDLAAEIDLRLAEFSNGHWTEDEFRNKVIPLVRVYRQTERLWGQSGLKIRTSSSSVTHPVRLSLGSGVDIRASVEYV